MHEPGHSARASVLVTGATGMIGRWTIASLISRGFRVYAVTSRVTLPADSRPLVHLVCLDLLDRQAIDAVIESIRPDGILHLAWETTHGHFWSSPTNEQWLSSSVELATSFARHGGRRLVVAGTCAEYDWSPEVLGKGLCSEESTPIRPRTVYGRTKARLLDTLSSHPGLTGVDMAWGRVFSAYGPGEAKTRLIPSIVTGLLNDQPVPIASGNQVRDYLHAQDIGAAFVSLFDSGVTGPVNIASGVPVSISALAQEIGQQLGRSHLLRIGEVREGVMDPLRLVADVTRLRREVGFTHNILLPSGLKDTISWWKTVGL